MDTPKLRILPRNEWYRLLPIFHEFNCGLPTNGNIIIAECGKDIAGFEVMHRELHVGPVYVAPKYRGTGLWPRMQAMCEAQLADGDYYYQYGTPDNERRLASFGLLPLGWSLWGKRVISKQAEKVRGVAVS